MLKITVTALALGAALAGGAAAQTEAQTAGGTVTVRLLNTSTDKGLIMGNLCSDAKRAFPGNCGPGYSATAKAIKGETVLTFKGVKPGTYAFQAVHDANGDGIPQIPGEGVAFGNDQANADFTAASFPVKGDMTMTVHLTYTPAAPAQGSKGAAAPAGVERIDVRERGLYGELYKPANATGRLPVIVVLGGSDGGLNSSGIAASFATKGFAAFALAYWQEQGLPQTLEDIPLEYFDTAVAWLKARPDVDPKGIGIMGWSRGSEAALLAASRNRDIHAVGLIAPTSIVWQGYDPRSFAGVDKPAWTVGGKAAPFVKQVARPYNPAEPMSAGFIATLPVADQRPDAAMPAEKVNGPILLLSGTDDRLWPAARMADRIVARLQGLRFPHSVEHLSYSGAGHAIFVGAPDGEMARNMTGASSFLGGTVAANRKAWEDNWPKTVAFFDKALKGKK